MGIEDIYWITPEFSVIVAGVVGLLVGSFLNVVIHRLPLMMQAQWEAELEEALAQQNPAAAEAAPPVEKKAPFNLLVPRSRCPHCGHQITALENIPVLSWLFLRGACRECRKPIPVRYPLVELLTGGLLLNLTSHGMAPLPDAVIGAMTGYLSLWSVYWLFKLLTGKEGMGYGDFKLLAALGAWFGWQALPAIILMSSVIGAVVGISLIFFKGHGRSQPIPFGPYLAGAGLAMLFLGGQVMTWMGVGVQPSVIIGP